MNTIHRVVFKSWGEFVETAENGKSEMENKYRASLEPREQSTGVATAKEAYKLAREGWKEGTQDIQDIARPLFNHVSKMIQRVEVSHDVEGHSIDVARFVDGEPEAWLKFEEVLKESENGHRMIRIVFNATASANVSKDVIQCKGAAVAALVELLEYAGHRVEVVLVEATAEQRDGEPVGEIYVRLKEFDQNLDTSVLAFALAHAATLRVLMFSIYEQMPKEIRFKCRVPGSYGSPADISKENRGDIYIGKSYGFDSPWQSVANAEKWIIKTLKEQGITLNNTVTV